MRLFTAIELPDEPRELLAHAQAELKQRIDGKVSWVAEKNLHVTLTFLGEVLDANVPAICEALKSIQMPRFSLAISLLGTLPPRGPARVLMAEVDGDVATLVSLFDSIERACEPLGYAREQRRFRPHVTLARFRRPRRVVREIEQVKLRATAAFVVREFVLMRSDLGHTGAQYQRVGSVCFP